MPREEPVTMATFPAKLWLVRFAAIYASVFEGLTLHIGISTCIRAAQDFVTSQASMSSSRQVRRNLCLSGMTFAVASKCTSAPSAGRYVTGWTAELAISSIVAGVVYTHESTTTARAKCDGLSVAWTAAITIS